MDEQPFEFDAPRDDLIRFVPFELVRSDDSDGLTLEGYAAVFNTPTRIDSWEGQFDEVIAPGAFKKTIRERTPVLMFDHGSHPMIGKIPLGAITTIREDTKGLYVKARLSDNWLIEPVRDAIRDEAITGMSFRFSVVKDEVTQRPRNVPLRTLREVKTPELGPVVFPAYTATSVGVRGAEIAGQLTDPEFRMELARALLLGTPLEAGSATSSPDAANPADEPALATPRTTRSERRLRAAQLRGVTSGQVA